MNPFGLANTTVSMSTMTNLCFPTRQAAANSSNTYWNNDFPRALRVVHYYIEQYFPRALRVVHYYIDQLLRAVMLKMYWKTDTAHYCIMLVLIADDIAPIINCCTYKTQIYKVRYTLDFRHPFYKPTLHAPCGVVGGWEAVWASEQDLGIYHG